MRVALVHDYLTQFGGAERVLMALMELFPHAPVFTLIYDDKSLGDYIDKKRLRLSFMQRIPGVKKRHRYFPLLMPIAMERFDLRDYDIVLSATHSFGKGVITGPDTMHISYCFTPIRYVWDDSHRYVREFSRSDFFQRFAPIGLSYIRLWDYYAAQRVDEYITLSRYVANRIKKYYHRSSTVIAPPLDLHNFEPAFTHDGYYLIVSRLMQYKRVDLAIEACERLGRSLKVVGTGPELSALKQKAGNNIEFLGFVKDEELPDIYSGARAFLFPQEEDFGITPLEAAATGKPTIAYGKGGALETIVDGKTGIFFNEQTSGSLIDAIRRQEEISWDYRAIRGHAESFRKEVFLQKMKKTVNDKWSAFKKKKGIHHERVSA